MKLCISKNPAEGFDVVVASTDAATDYMSRYGCPEFIEFHDTDNDDTSAIIEWIIEMDSSLGGDWIPIDFTYDILLADINEMISLDTCLSVYLSTREKEYCE